MSRWQPEPVEAEYLAAVRSPPNRASPARRRKLSGAALRTFRNIARLWEMGEADQMRALGLSDRAAYGRWVAAAEAGSSLVLPAHSLLRISVLLGIHEALAGLFRTPADAVTWLRSPKEPALPILGQRPGPKALAFGGVSPLARITSGSFEELLEVRRHLEAWLAGAFMVPLDPDFERQVYTDEDILFE